MGARSTVKDQRDRIYKNSSQLIILLLILLLILFFILLRYFRSPPPPRCRSSPPIAWKRLPQTQPFNTLVFHEKLKSVSSYKIYLCPEPWSSRILFNSYRQNPDAVLESFSERFPSVLVVDDCCVGKAGADALRLGIGNCLNNVYSFFLKSIWLNKPLFQSL